AIPADPGIPVLAGLAADPAIHGTVVMEFMDDAEASTQRRWHSTRYENYYETQDLSLFRWDFAASEAYLEDWLHAHLRSYADGTRPVTALVQRLLGTDPARTYVTLLPDRERWLDFSSTDARKLYYGTVRRTLGGGTDLDPQLPAPVFEAHASDHIARITPEDDRVYLKNIQSLAAMSSAISARGGRVIFVAMPLSGDMRRIMEHRYPRTTFWDRFAQTPGIHSFNFDDDPSMRALICPDGSHLDQSDRTRFTMALVNDLHLDNHAQHPPAPSSATGE
ncbi:MAG TPA: hypothetical protein VKT74_02015, partial [Gammaproteobacteria bacterium]|nr:hypothetical protein [Gammaproteobacteria bacterium]